MIKILKNGWNIINMNGVNDILCHVFIDNEDKNKAIRHAEWLKKGWLKKFIHVNKKKYNRKQKHKK